MNQKDFTVYDMGVVLIIVIFLTYAILAAIDSVRYISRVKDYCSSINLSFYNEKGCIDYTSFNRSTGMYRMYYLNTSEIDMIKEMK